tara:strand:- start:3571 stop:3870 length:300 start_codon:yes stop_codon:yes gene_type:complete
MIINWLLAIISIALIVSLYYNYKFANIILKITDSLETSLDILDDRYSSVSKILEIPIFYDSPQIRQVINDIKDSRDSILRVANEIAKIENEENQIDERP